MEIKVKCFDSKSSAVNNEEAYDFKNKLKNKIVSCRSYFKNQIAMHVVTYY
jgi:hypothetical protein|tara:strand:+ start:7370 stop:7522 length:153 start_codon:yes stop_codon:yes gene_type:complete